MISRTSYELLAVFRLKSMRSPFDQPIDLQRALQLEQDKYLETREVKTPNKMQDSSAPHDFWMKLTPPGEDALEAFEDAERHAKEEKENRKKDRRVQILIATLSFLGGIFTGGLLSEIIKMVFIE